MRHILMVLGPVYPGQPYIISHRLKPLEGNGEYKLTNGRILVYYLTLKTRETRRYTHTSFRSR
jgi:hypothetical protein